MARVPVETIALGAAVAALALLARPAASVSDEALPENLAAPPWPLPDVGFAPVIAPPFPGGHEEFDNQILYAVGLVGLTDPLAPLLVKAIIAHESGWNARALGDAGCSKGLMQVNGCAHPSLDRDRGGAYDLFEPNQNILAGTQLLAGAWVWWPDWERVLVAYNGPALAQAGTRSNRYSQAVAPRFVAYAATAGVAV